MRWLKSLVGWIRVIAFHAPSLPRYWKRQFVNSIFWELPDDELSAVFRAWVARMAGCKTGQGAMIRQGVRLGGFRLSVGKFTSIGACSHLDCHDEAIDIGDHVVLSPKVTILTATHGISGFPGRVGETKAMPVTIEDGAWLCTNCTILPGVRIGSRSIVAAGAVVHRDVPSNVMVGGVPADIVKHLDDEDRSVDPNE